MAGPTNKIYPDDTITIILTEMGLEERPIPFKEDVFYNIIYRYSQEYPDIFSEFTFDTYNTFPYSELLERILARHRISRILNTINPHDEEVQLKSGTKDYVDRKIKPKFEPLTLEVLHRLGKELTSELIR